MKRIPMNIVFAFMAFHLFEAFHPTPSAAGPDKDFFERARADMVQTQIVDRGVKDPKVLSAMRRVPRHRFVPPVVRRQAYDDGPLPIGYDQTISQPFIVAAMTEQLGLTGMERVLEIGTGSGYQAAVLAEIVPEVYTIEIIPELGRSARETLSALKYKNIFVKTGDGWEGWPEKAPFDAIIVTAAAAEVPQKLVDQLKPGGRMVLPLGPEASQELVTLRKTPRGLEKEVLYPVRFVPFVRPGRAE